MRKRTRLQMDMDEAQMARLGRVCVLFYTAGDKTPGTNAIKEIIKFLDEMLIDSTVEEKCLEILKRRLERTRILLKNIAPTEETSPRE